MATATYVRDSVDEIIHTMTISDVCRSELYKCLANLSSTDGDRALYENITDAILTAGKVKSEVNFEDIVLSCMKFAEAIDAILQLVRPDVYQVFGRVLKVVTAICPLMFETADVVTKVMDGLKQILDDDMKHKCEGVKKEIWESVAYLNGLPSAEKVSREDRNIVLSGLGHGFTEKGSKLLGKIMSKILDMAKKPKMLNFDVFMKYIELYCSLSTLRLLLLLYLFAILSAYDAPNANSVKQVLVRHREDDKIVFNGIRFLHKPRKDTLLLHLEYSEQNRKIVQNFFNKHETSLDPSRFYNKELKIFSKRDEKKTLCLREHSFPYLNLIYKQGFMCVKYYLHCIENSGTEDDVFQFCKSERGGKWCSMNPVRRRGEDVNMEDFLAQYGPGSYTKRNPKWRLVEMELDAPDQTSTFVILIDSKPDACLYACPGGEVYVLPFRSKDYGFLWKLKVL